MVLVWYWYVRLVLLVKKRIHSQIQQAIQLTTILKYSKQSILKYDIKKRGGGELLIFRIQADETVHLCGFFLGFGIGVKYCTRGHAVQLSKCTLRRWCLTGRGTPVGNVAEIER